MIPQYRRALELVANSSPDLLGALIGQARMEAESVPSIRREVP
jgi:hypothetical protein